MLFNIIKRLFLRTVAVIETPFMFVLSLATTSVAAAMLTMPVSSAQAIAHNSSVAAKPAPGAFIINSARWDKDSYYKRIVIEGMGRRGQVIAVTNANTGASVGETIVRYTKWRVRQDNPQQIHCRIRALTSNGESAEKAVEGAPSNCAGGANMQPAAPVPQVAN